MLLTYYSCPVCAKHIVISPVLLICVKATDVRACQNISSCSVRVVTEQLTNLRKLGLDRFASTLWSTAHRYLLEGRGLEDQKVCNFKGCYLIFDNTVNNIM